MANEVKVLITGLYPELPESKVDSIVPIIESHMENKDANPNTVAMSLGILIKLSKNNPDLNFSAGTGILKRDKTAEFIIDFDMDEFALVADPFKMIENALMNDCIHIIEEDIRNTKMKTLSSQALIYDITKLGDPQDKFVVKLHYSLS